MNIDQIKKACPPGSVMLAYAGAKAQKVKILTYQPMNKVDVMLLGTKKTKIETLRIQDDHGEPFAKNDKLQLLMDPVMIQENVTMKSFIEGYKNL
jgi:hypothetical protein